MISDGTILRHIERQSKRMASFKQLVRELGIHGPARRELRERLERLVKSGELVAAGDDRYSLPQAARSNVVAGRLSLHRDGYGFVTPEDAALREKLTGDVYI
ncbi:MAG: ribonuclease R, partial [Terriglobales bacterium]